MISLICVVTPLVVGVGSYSINSTAGLRLLSNINVMGNIFLTPHDWAVIRMCCQSADQHAGAQLWGNLSCCVSMIRQFRILHLNQVVAGLHGKVVFSPEMRRDCESVFFFLFYLSQQMTSQHPAYP